MAALIWETYRNAGTVNNTGAVVHYYDESAQSIYLDGDLSTNVTNVEDGHWKTASYEGKIDILTSSIPTMDLDHPLNGVLYASSAVNGTLTFMRYVYAMDLSHLMESWSWMLQADNAIAQFTGSIQNISADIFTDIVTLFQPGARITVAIKMGDSQTYTLGTAWVDEFNYDVTSETVDVSGRNTIGYFLKDQTFDDAYEYTGVSSDIAAQILAYAGITKYMVQPGTDVPTFTFNPSDSLLDGLTTMCSYYTIPEKGWKVVELPDGTVCVGYDYWLASMLPNGRYTFQENRDVFRRQTTKLADGSYTSLRATGKNVAYVPETESEEPEEEDPETEEPVIEEYLTPVTVPIANFPYWALGPHRTKHIEAPNAMTQEGLQAWAEAQAENLQYVGIGEQFVGRFQPNLIVGDIAEVVEGSTGTSLGIVTEVKHTFSRQDGFRTEFSVDSGGVATDGENYVIYSRTAQVNGFNRKQRIADLVNFIAKR